MKIFNKNKKNLFIVLISAALVILIGYFAYAYVTKSAWPFVTTTETDSSETYTPPTKQEVIDSQDAKKNNAEQETQTPQKTVSVAIAFADFDEMENAIDVRAFTPDVIEADAMCTASFTQNAQTVTKSSKSFIDSTSSQCEPILVPLSEFPMGGIWQLIVSYSSNNHKGESSPVNVEVSK